MFVCPYYCRYFTFPDDNLWPYLIFLFRCVVPLASLVQEPVPCVASTLNMEAATPRT